MNLCIQSSVLIHTQGPFLVLTELNLMSSGLGIGGGAGWSLCELTLGFLNFLLFYVFRTAAQLPDTGSQASKAVMSSIVTVQVAGDMPFTSPKATCYFPISKFGPIYNPVSKNVGVLCV